MKATLVNDDRSLRWDDVPNPVLGDDDCLVKIEAAALNRADLMQREGMILGVGAKMFSCCGARCAHCRRCGCVAHRPLPLAQVASSATGGAPIAPHRRPGDRLWYKCKRGVWLDLLDYHIILIVGQPSPGVRRHRRSGVPTQM